MHKILYLDTNIFLHYQPFNQINWLEIVKAKTATIIIPPVTIRELNKHKDSHPRAQIKKRAGEAIKRLSGLLDTGRTAKIREEVFVFFEDRDSTIDFSTHQLSFNVQDDQLIASILLNKQETPDAQIVLVTSDLGLALISKAGRQGISTQKMPENLRIADESDPNENKVKQLEQQIRELNSRTPDLTLVYENGEKHTTVTLLPSAKLSENEIEEKINEIKNEFPKRSKEKEEEIKDKASTSQNTIEKVSMIAAMSIMNLIPKEEIERYNNEVDKYIPSYSKFIARNLEYENLKRRTFKLDIALANDGTTPAEDIDIYMHFPDGFQLLEEDEFPDPPEPPRPPVKPMTEMERMAKSMNFNYSVPSSVYFSQSNSLPGPPTNVSGPSIKRVNSFEVHIHVQKLKHNLQEFLDPLFVIFDSFESANSFTIDYRILAANIPHEVTGNLHIVVQKEI